MVSRVLLWTGALGVSMGLGACGKSGGSGPLPAEEFSGRLAVIVCDSIASCCTNASLSFDNEGCKRTLAAQVEREQQETSPRAVYDPNAAGDCVDALAASVQCGQLGPVSPPSCQEIWRGTVALGKLCESSEECAPSGLDLVACAGEVSPRVCTVRPRAPRGSEGEICIFSCPSGAACEGVFGVAPDGEGSRSRSLCHEDDGLFCDQGTCAKLVELGDDCTVDSACGGEAYCDPSAGVCKAQKEDGAPCTGDVQCRSRNCEGPDRPGAPTFPEDMTPNRCLARDIGSAELCSEDFSSPSGP